MGNDRIEEKLFTLFIKIDPPFTVIDNENGKFVKLNVPREELFRILGQMGFGIIEEYLEKLDICTVTKEFIGYVRRALPREENKE